MKISGDVTQTAVDHLAAKQPEAKDATQPAGDSSDLPGDTLKKPDPEDWNHWTEPAHCLQSSSPALTLTHQHLITHNHVSRRRHFNYSVFLVQGLNTMKDCSILYFAVQAVHVWYVCVSAGVVS